MDFARAIVWTAYGPADGLRLVEFPKPAPRPGEVLVRIRATAVTAGDTELRALRFGLGMRLLVRLYMGWFHPRNKILGQEFSGDVEAVGEGSTRFRVGDLVYGTTGFGFGAYAEYLCVREDAPDAASARKPANMTHEEAATVPTGGMEALHFFRKAGELRGRKVLVNGAGGGIGLFAVQLAKLGGAEVTGVDSAPKLDLLRQVGADHVIDFSESDFTSATGTYDVIFDSVGRSRFSACMAALRPQGCLLIVNPGLSALVRAPFASAIGRKRVVTRGSPPRPDDLDYLRALIEARSIRAILSSCFPLERMAEAHRFVDAGRAVGRVAITC